MGYQANIVYTMPGQCNHCRGKGSVLVNGVNGGRWHRCPMCNGSGKSKY